MTQVHNAPEAAHTSRRAPVSHSEAVQEAKRREKMETVCSSHRVSGTVARQAPPPKAPAAS